MLEIDTVRREDPSALEPLPPEEGLALARNYERKNQEHKVPIQARGEQQAEASSPSKEASAVQPPIQSRKPRAKTSARAVLTAAKKEHSTPKEVVAALWSEREYGWNPTVPLPALRCIPSSSEVDTIAQIM